MITRRVTGFSIHPLRLQAQVIAQQSSAYTSNKRVCPGSTKSRKTVCPGSGKGKISNQSGGGPTGYTLKRATESGKCRFGFIPDEWFKFLYSKTGVSGPYILMLGFTNYVVSKELYVMEHEYYSGLSIALILFLITKNFGKQVGAILDKEVQAVEDDLQKSRNVEIASHKTVIKEGELAQARAKAQDILMAAKKENIAFQLEAEYRERLMRVYRAVRDRLLYHMKISRTVSRIQQRWMIQWILQNVHKSITPEFQKEALSSAIRDLAATASQIKK